MTNTVSRKIAKGAVSMLMAAAMTLGMACAPADNASAEVSGTVLCAEAATENVIDINSTPTYKALTKSKVTALYKSAFSGSTGSYVSGKPSTYYKNGKQPYFTNGGYAGVLTSDTLKAAEKALNAYRTLAGLSEIPVYSDSTYQAAALIRSYDGNYSHDLYMSTVKKPAGFSSSLLSKGVNCFNHVLSRGTTPTECFPRWISEKNNALGATDTGHRMCILQANLKAFNLGYSDRVALGTAVKESTCTMKEAISAYPSPGYMPTQMVQYAPAPWVAQLNSSVLCYTNRNDVKVTVTAPDGKSYACTAANGKLKFGYRGTDYLEFTRPEIKTDRYTGTYKVKITGLRSSADKTPVTVKYSVKFYDAEAASASDSTGTTTKPSTQTGSGSTSTTTKPSTQTGSGSTGTTTKPSTQTSSGSTDTTTKPSTQTGSGSTGSTTKPSTQTGTSSAKTNISDCRVCVVSYLWEYTGKEIKLAPNIFNGSTKLVQGTDYTLSYSNNINVGYAKIIITGKGSYTGTKTETFRITEPAPRLNYSSKGERKISDCKFNFEGFVGRFAYTGSSIKPRTVLRYNAEDLVEGKDYSVTYSDCVNPGKAKVVITGKGRYTGTRTINYEIFYELNANSVRLTNIKSNYKYTGARIRPEPKVYFYGKLLVKDRDYTLEYCDNRECGTALLYIRGKGEYKDKYKFKFTIS